MSGLLPSRSVNPGVNPSWGLRTGGLARLLYPRARHCRKDPLRRLKSWSAEAIRSVKPKQVFFAYDTPAALAALARAADLRWNAGFTKAAHQLRTDVLGGCQREDRPDVAELRLRHVPPLGIFPTAVLCRGSFSAASSLKWPQLRQSWARPTSTGRRPSQSAGG